MTATLREEDIRPARLMADKRAAIEHDRRFLLDRRDRWVGARCPACGGNDRAAFGEKNGFSYEQCAQCRTIYTSPRPSADLLAEFYAQSANYAYWNEHIFPATEDSRRERIFRPRAERTIELAERAGIGLGTIVEIGAAFGTFCDQMRTLAQPDRIIAVEPTPGLAQTCRDRGFETIERVIEDITPEPIADLVCAFEVIEHLFDPAAFIQRAAGFLRPGGMLLLTCPNGLGFDNATLGLGSGTFDHEHLNYFNPRSLAGLIESIGLEVVSLSTPGQLDTDLVKKCVDAGEISLENQPFLQQVFGDRYDEVSGAFQEFLAANQLSGHLWIAALSPTN